MNETPGARRPLPAAGRRRASLGALAIAFLKLGTVAFGGPAAHIAMMEDEFVRRREWLTRQDFLDLVGAASLIPGPSSTEVAIYIGYRRAGAMGLALAGACFILPAALMVGAIAWAYARYGELPHAQAILIAVKPVVIAIVFHALYGFAKTALKNAWLSALAACAIAAALLGAPPLAILAVAASLGVGSSLRRRDARVVFPPLLPGLAPISGAAAMAAKPSLASIFLVFLKIGATTFGSGYVLLAFLRSDLVVNARWLTEPQLIDAVAIGQVTPGPLFTTATFIGYLLGGARGAALATLGIFLPSFVLVAITGPFLARIRRSPAAARALDAVNVASLALMAATTAELAWSIERDALSIAVTLVSVALLARFRVNTTWLVAGAAALGLALELAHLR